MSPTRTGTVESGEILTYSIPPELSRALRDAQKGWNESNGTARLWAKDPSLWTNSDENRWLDWLDVIARQLGDLSKFQALGAEVREDGLTQLVILGGAASRVLVQTYDRIAAARNGCLDCLSLNSMDPAQIRDVRSRIDPLRTLFCVSETGQGSDLVLLARYFFEETQAALENGAGQHFIAIAQPNSELEAFAIRSSFRQVYRAEPGLPAVYSGLADGGLIPHAAAGHDTEKLLRHAARTVDLSRTSDINENPGVSLGTLLATAAARFGRDKLTLVHSPSLRHFAAWVQELLGRSSRLIPILGEPLTEAESYGSDRLFLYLKYAHEADREVEKSLSEFQKSGLPVLHLSIEHLTDVASAMFMWQIAAAVAAALLHVNPIQPDTRNHELTPIATVPLMTQDCIQLFADPWNASAVQQKGESLGGLLRRHLDRIHPGDYFGLLAHIPMFPEYEEILQQIRQQVLESSGVATVLQYGSVAQQDSGVFLQITSHDAEDLPVPDLPDTFGSIKAARAQTEFQALAQRSLRVLRVHLGSDLRRGLHQLRDLICAAVEH